VKPGLPRQVALRQVGELALSATQVRMVLQLLLDPAVPLEMPGELVLLPALLLQEPQVSRVPHSGALRLELALALKFSE
jgi:hypothetical protein